MGVIVKNWKNFARILFILALLCFFLPFAVVSCQDQNIKTFTGMELVMGAKIENSITGQIQTIHPAFQAIFMFIVVITGILILFLLKRDNIISIIVTLFGAMGVFLNFYLQSDLTRQAEKNGLKVEYKSGLTLLLVIFILSAGLGVVRFLSQSDPHQALTARKICPHCGANNQVHNAFCSQCGKSLGNPGTATSAETHVNDLRD